MSWKCEKCHALNDEIHERCWKCQVGRYSLEETSPETTLLSSTTMQIPGREIGGSLGVVFGEAILGANILRDILAGVRDIVGGRSGTYEAKLREGRTVAMREMLLDAKDRGADAVVGIDVDYETVGGTMLMICVSGTAVTLKPVE